MCEPDLRGVKDVLRTLPDVGVNVLVSGDPLPVWALIGLLWGTKERGVKKN